MAATSSGSVRAYRAPALDTELGLGIV